MKKKSMYWLVLAGLIIAPSVYAKTLTGTVTDIDTNAGVLTLMQAGTNEAVKVKMSDTSQLRSLTNGTVVSLEAAKIGDSWSAHTVTTDPSSTSASASEIQR